MRNKSGKETWFSATTLQGRDCLTRTAEAHNAQDQEAVHKRSSLDRKEEDHLHSTTEMYLHIGSNPRYTI